MKIVIAPDSFKESLSAKDAAEAMAEGLLAVFPQAACVLVPMADGGEGTTDAVVCATAGAFVRAAVRGPLGEPMEARFGRTGDGATAVIEMAEASGLCLVPPDCRDPLLTTSYGTGQLIRAALNAGARHLVLGLGGSATCDGGAGMLQALGVRLTTDDGTDIEPGGGGLKRLASIDASGLDPRLAACTLDVACDVDNPLCGPQGAAAVFGPQKGATPDMVRELDENLRQMAEVARRCCGVDMAGVPGAGAAGGMGGAAHAFLRGRLRAGVDIVAEAVGLDAHMEGADLVFTGEGRIDGQTARGKTPVGVARVAARHGVPVIAIGGSLGPEAEAVLSHGISAVAGAVAAPCTVAEALANGRDNLRAAARNAAALLALGMRLPRP